MPRINKRCEVYFTVNSNNTHKKPIQKMAKKETTIGAVKDDSVCTIKGTKGSPHLITDKLYKNIPAKQANILIEKGHAELVSSEKAPERFDKK